MATNAASRQRPAYGTDAPGVQRGLLATGILLSLIGAAAGLLWRPQTTAGIIVIAALAIAATVSLALGCSMLAYSAAGKMRMRDFMLSSIPWSGEEHVLDIGTGAGLLMIGAARRLTTGRSVGIDIWSAKDLSNNAIEAAENNARIEGVQDRTELQTADAIALPMADNTFDRILSLLCLHNIPDKLGQARACHEIARVLKPGGIALIADYVPTTSYAAAFKEAGLLVSSSKSYFAIALGPAWMVRAEKPADERKQSFFEKKDQKTLTT